MIILLYFDPLYAFMTISSNVRVFDKTNIKKWGGSSDKVNIEAHYNNNFSQVCTQIFKQNFFLECHHCLVIKYLQVP